MPKCTSICLLAMYLIFSFMIGCETSDDDTSDANGYPPDNSRTDGDTPDEKDFKWSRSDLLCEIECIQIAGHEYLNIEDGCLTRCGKSCFSCESGAKRGNEEYEGCAFDSLVQKSALYSGHISCMNSCDGPTRSSWDCEYEDENSACYEDCNQQRRDCLSIADDYDEAENCDRELGPCFDKCPDSFNDCKSPVDDFWSGIIAYDCFDECGPFLSVHYSYQHYDDDVASYFDCLYLCL